MPWKRASAPNSNPSGWRSAPVIAAIASVLALLAALPALSGDGALGDRYVDGLGSWWFQWWLDHALRTGEPVLHAGSIFFPWGKDLLRDTGANLVDAALAVPLRRLAGPIFAWNGLYIGILATNGVAAGLWLRWRGHSATAAWAATAVSTLHPFVLFELAEGRPTQALLAPLIATMALAESAMTAESHRRGCLQAGAAGVALAITGWTYWFAGLFAALAILPLWAGRPMVARSTRLVVIGAVALALTAPVVLPLVQALDSGQIASLVPADRWLAGDFTLTDASGDPLGLCVLGLEGTANHINQWGTRIGGQTVGIGVGLACLASVLTGWRWPTVTLLAVAVAIGPFPLGVPNPVYLGLTATLPPLERLYWPCRAVVLLVPVSAVGLAALVDGIRQTGSRRGWSRTATVAAALALPLGGLAEGAARGQWPLHTWDTTVSEGWKCLGGQSGAIIVLPFGRDHESLLFQTVHELPQLGGMNEQSTSQVPTEWVQLTEQNSWLRAVVRANRNPRDTSDWTVADRSAVHDLGYEWLAIRVRPMSDPANSAGEQIRLRAARLRLEALAGPIIWKDDEVWLYAPWGQRLSCATPR